MSKENVGFFLEISRRHVTDFFQLLQGCNFLTFLAVHLLELVKTGSSGGKAFLFFFFLR